MKKLSEDFEIYKGNWVSIWNKPYLDDRYEYLVDRNGAAVSIVPFSMKDDKLYFLIRREVVPSWSANNEPQYSCIGGGVEQGEYYEEAAIRELYEESGYKVKSLISLGFCMASKANGTLYPLYTVYIEEMDTRSGPTDGTQNEKDSWNEWMSFEEIKRLIFENKIVDSILITAVMKTLLESNRSNQ